jgi:hypothetical protein
MPRSDEYTKVKEQVTEGIYEMVEPLDYLILDALPKQGMTLGGVTPLGETARNLQATKFSVLEVSAIAGRLHALGAAGLAVPIKMAAAKGSKGWQVTPQGRKYVEAWKATRKENETE